MPEQNLLENLDDTTKQKIQEMQMLEQGFQQIMMQKQAFTHELNETDYALKELDKSQGDVFKIVGQQVVIKSTKETLTKEMKHKKELIETRMKTLEKQEKEMSDKLESLRQEIMKKISPQEKNKK